jgi:cysteine desulfurase
MKTPIYLDYNATTPILKEVADEMKPYLYEHFGNPSSSHIYGQKTKHAIDNARTRVAKLLNCSPNELIFTSGGSESNNYAIKGYAFANKHKGNHIITSSVEHPAVLEVCGFLETKGFDVTYLPVDKNGRLVEGAFEEAIKPNTILATIMHANNEVGVIQPIKSLAEIAHKRGVIFHTDAAQSVGKIKTDVQEMGIDMMSVAAHKFYGPKGIGVLYIKDGIKLEKLIHGANHERNLRAGTENIIEVVGIGKAAEIANSNLQSNMKHYAEMRDLFENLIKEKFPNIIINGENVQRLPNTSSISIPNVEANTLLDKLDGIAASAGAACHSETINVSTVLEAMKIPIKYAMGTIRISVGVYTNISDIERSIEMISEGLE